MTIKKHQFEQGAALYEADVDVDGICMELTRRWVKAQLTGAWQAGQTIYEWTDISAGTLSDVLQKQAQRGKLRDVAVEGLSHVSGPRRTGGGTFSKFEGLRTREDVINHVMSVKGVYIYAATSEHGKGHAFAFDTRDSNQVAFFDPNQGEFVFTNEALASIRDWWKRFWDASGEAGSDGNRNYKKAFHKGLRELFKYDVPPSH